MEIKNDIKEKKGKRLRSPGYPMISLQEAIERARILWDKDKNNFIPKEAAFKHLGFTHIGGYGARIIAALKHFGLISEKGNGIILTQDAVDLNIYKPTDEDYINIVKKIALKPDTYRKIYNEFNENIPSDDTLRIKLIKEYKFNHDKVKGFINDFRRTLSFAGLVEKEEETKDMQKTNADVTVNAEPLTISTKISAKVIISYPIPLSEGKNATITFSSLPIKKKDVDAIKKWLEFFSDNLTETEERQGKQ